jgi:radical SAM protein with 4Fe4S-binding SPASM domain
MEFIDLGRHLDITDPIVRPISQLRRMTPILVDQSLELLDTPENLARAGELAGDGWQVVRIEKRSPESTRVERIDFPRRVILELTSKCNFLCRMCPQNGLERPRMHLDRETCFKVLDELEEQGIEGLWLYHLGESILHPEFKEIMEYMSSKDNLGLVWLSTNGHAFSGKHIRTVIDSKVDFLNYSLHALTEEVYQTVAPHGDFDKVKGNLKRFWEIKEEVKGNHGPKKPYLHLQMIEQETTQGQVDGFIRKYNQKAEIVSVNMLEYVNLPNNKFGRKQRERKPLTNCKRVDRGDCFIMSNGEVTLCDVAVNAEIRLGNVGEESLFDIWNGRERSRLLELSRTGRMSRNPFCAKCTDYDI